jgi:radical SAM modification target selenobiotic family peptide
LPFNLGLWSFSVIDRYTETLKKGGEYMDKQDLKKILAGVSVAGLLTGSIIGCAPQQQQSTTSGKETAAPAQTQETKSPNKETPAPGS